jgi:N-acetylmuramoyl-L-alanine amidase
MAKVFLSAGHGGSDPGAVGNGLKEKDINLQTLRACKAELEAHGVEVVASRTTDENDPVGQEVKEANASKADVAVSFHVNAGGGDGFEAFYHTSSAKGKKLAQLGEKYVKAMGQNSRGIKSGNHLYFVKNTTMTAVLFESFFLDSSDKTIGDTKAEQKAFGVAYAKAILEYFGIAYTETKEKPTETKENTPTTNNTIYRVQVGAYGVKANAEAMQKKLKAAGFDAYITTS